MATRGWVIRGEGADLHIYEEEFSKNRLLTETPASYVEAKALALQKLQPVVDRYSELANDDFAVSGVLPPYKAWVKVVSLGFRKSDQRFVVTAKTKKRAMEILKISRSSMEWSWRPCNGNWWYHLAHEEAIWAEEIDRDQGGNGHFLRPLSREEALSIGEQELENYRMLSYAELLLQRTTVKTQFDESSSGTPYRIRSSVYQCGISHDMEVEIEVDDCLEWEGKTYCFLNKEAPKLEAVNWKASGF